MAVTGTPTDAELTAQLLQTFTALGGVGNPEVITLPWTPVPKARPRFARGRAYHDPKDKDAEAKTGAMLRYKATTLWSANVCVVAGFVRHDRRWMDVDNLMKHLLDSANGVLFYDDAQVTASAQVLEYGPGAARTVLVVGEHASSMPRTVPATSPRRTRRA